MNSEDLVARTNNLLGDISLSSVEELKRSAASLFVLLYERTFGRLVEIVRKPSYVADYIHNAQVVLSNLRRNLPFLAGELDALTAADVQAGDDASIDLLLRVFEMTSSASAAAVASSSATQHHHIQSNGDDFDAYEDLGNQFPIALREIRDDLSKLRAVAAHSRSSVGLDDPTRHGRRALEAKMTRLKKDAEVEARISALKAARTAEVRQRNAVKDAKIERLRVQRLAQDLELRERSNALKRRDAEHRLVKELFRDAFRVEKARLLDRRDAERGVLSKVEQNRLDAFEALKTRYDHETDALDARLQSERERMLLDSKHKVQAIRELTANLKKDFTARIETLTQELETLREEKWKSDEDAIRVAFELVDDNQAKRHAVQLSVLGGRS